MTKMISLVRTLCVMAIVSLLAQSVWAEGTADENGITPSIWYTFDEGASPVSNHGSYAKSGDKDVTSGEFALVSGTDYAWKIGSSTLELAALNDGLVNMYPATYRVKINLNGQTYANAVIWGTNGKAYNGPALMVNGDPTTGYTVKLHRHASGNVGDVKLSYTVPADKVTGYHSYVVTIADKSNSTCVTTLYVDGAQVATVNENWGTQNSGTLLGQAGNGYSKVATGLLYSDFRFYTQTFTAAQVATLEGVPLAMYYNQLAGGETIPANTYGAITIDESTGGIKATSYSSNSGLSGTGVGSFAAAGSTKNGRKMIDTHTIAGWFKVGELPTGDATKDIFVMRTGTDTYNGYKVVVDANGVLKIGRTNYNNGNYSWNDNKRVSLTGASEAIASGKWFHLAIACTYDSNGSYWHLTPVAWINGAAATKTGDDCIDINLNGPGYVDDIRIGAGISAAGIYVDPRALSSVDLIKAIAVDPTFVRAVNSVFKTTLTANTNYSAITWDKGTAPASGDAAEITVTADVTLTLDQAIAADSIKVKGENAITLVGEYLTAENLAKIDNSEMTGAVKVNAVPSWDLKTSDNLTYIAGAGASNARKTITQDGGTITLAGSDATYYLNGGASGTSSTVTFDGSTVDYGTGVISVGVATYNFNNATVTADRLVTSNEADGRNSTINISGNSSITLANTTLATGTGAAVLLGHWKSATTTFNMTGGTLDVANGGFRIGWDSAANATIGGGTTAATLKAKQVKMGGERSNTCSLTIGSNGTVEIGESGMHIASGTLTLNGGTIKAMANNTISVPGTLALSAPSTIDSNGYDVTLTVSGTMSGAGSIAKVGEGKLTMGTLRPKMSAFAGQLGLTLTAEEFAAGKIALPVSSDISSSFSTTSVTILKPNGTDAATWATENPITYNSETGAVEFNLAAIAPITVDTADKSFSAAIGDATTGVLAIVGTDSDETAFTVTIDCEVPEGVSVVVSGHVKFVATEGNTVPYGSMTYNEGATISVPSVADSTIPSGVTMNVGALSGTITNNGTLNVTGTCSFKLINTGTITIKNGANATIDANDQSISGTVIVEQGATFTNARSTDAITYNGTVNVHVYGTLAFGSTRWTFGANSSLYLYTGATVTGAGEGSNGTLDFNGGNGNIFVKPNGSTTGTVTCSAPMRNREGGTIIVDQNMTFETTGNLISYGDGKPTKAGNGTWTIKGGNIGNNIAVNAGTLKLVAINLASGKGITMGDGTLELAQNENGDAFTFTGTVASSSLGKGAIKTAGSTVTLSGTFTNYSGDINSSAANSKFIIPDGQEVTVGWIVSGSAIEIEGMLVHTNKSTTTYTNYQPQSLSGLTGNGTFKIVGPHYFFTSGTTSFSDYWASTLAICNERGESEPGDNRGIVWGQPDNGNKTISIGTLSGFGMMRTDANSGSRNLKVTQAADSVWSGVFYGTNDRLGTFIVAGKDDATAKTLTLSGTQTHTNDLTIEGTGSVKLTGTWKAGTVTVNGRLEVLDTATLTKTTLTSAGSMKTADSTIYFGSDEIASVEAVAKVGTTYYASIEDAIAALGEGQKVTAITLVGDSVTTLPEGQEDYKIVDGVIVAKTYYTVTIGEHANATISTIPNSVREDNAGISFTVTPETGYEVTAVKANDTVLEEGETGYTYTVTADTTITVETSKIQVTITVPTVDNTTVTVSVGDLVEGKVVVDYGTEITVTYTPYTNYVGGGAVTMTATTDTTIDTSDVTTPSLRAAGTIYSNSKDFSSFKLADSKDATVLDGDVIAIADGYGVSRTDRWAIYLNQAPTGHTIQIAYLDNNTDPGVSVYGVPAGMNIEIVANCRLYMQGDQTVNNGATITGAGKFWINDNTVTIDGAVSISSDITFKTNGTGTIKLADGATLTCTKLADGKVTSAVSTKMPVYENGKYTLETIVAKVDDTPYASIGAAISAAGETGTVTLVDTTLDAPTGYAKVTKDEVVTLRKAGDVYYVQGYFTTGSDQNPLELVTANGGETSFLDGDEIVIGDKTSKTEAWFSADSKLTKITIAKNFTMHAGTTDAILNNATITVDEGKVLTISPDRANTNLGAVTINGEVAVSGTTPLAFASVSGTCTITLADGKEITVGTKAETVTIASGVDHKHVVKNGTTYSLAWDQVTITVPSIDNTTVAVTGGTLADNAVVVDYGTAVTVSYTANENYKLVGGDGVYTFDGTANGEAGTGLSADLDVTTITIPTVANMTAAVVDGNGQTIAISESNTITVTIGSTFTVTYTPAEGYIGSTITLDAITAAVGTTVTAPTEGLPVPAVAKIGTTLVSAADFRTKVNAIADTQTVQLLADIDLGTTYVTIKAGAAVTLDLNGKTITSSGSYAVSLTGSLTVKDSATGGKIANTKASSGKTIYGSKGTLTLESGTIEATAAAVSVGTVNISGGTITAGTGNAVSGSGTISGGTITSTSLYAAYADQSGKALVITDGTLKGAAAKGDVGIYTGNVKVTGIEGVKIAFASNASGLVLADTDAALIPAVADVAVYDGETLEGYYFSASSNGLYTGCKGKTCKLVKNIDHQIAIGVNTTLDLNGHNITVTDAISAILVKSGTSTAVRTVTITGEGTVSCDNGSGCNAVQVQRYADVTIAGGSYYVGADTASSDPDNATIYIVDSYKADPTKVTITGGTFEAAGSGDFTLNILDSLLKAEAVPTISVSGGTFKHFNPSNCVSEGAGTNFVAEGYESVKGNDDCYYVQVKTDKPVVPEVEATDEAITPTAPQGGSVEVITPNGTTLTGENAKIDLDTVETAAIFTVVTTTAEGVKTVANVGVVNAKDAETTTDRVTTAVAVPFEGATVAKLLNTALLAEGDTLTAYVGGRYEIWDLDSDKVWQPHETITLSGTYTAPAAAETALGRGTAVWVKTAGKIVVLGKYNESAAVVEPTEGETNLLANPTMKPYTPSVKAGDAQDQIVTIGITEKPVRYTKKNGKWTTPKPTGVKIPGTDIEFTADAEENPEIPVGKGFWFIKK